MKKFTGLLFCLMFFCVTVLSGCTLVTTDLSAYRNAVVASAYSEEYDTTITVNKYELEQAYNNYASYGLSGEQYVEQALSSLVNNKIELEEAKRTLPQELEDNEKGYIWSEVIDALQQNIITPSTGDTSSNTSSTRVQTVYSPKASPVKVGDSFVIKRAESEIPQREIDGFDYKLFNDNFASFKSRNQVSFNTNLPIDEQYKNYAYGSMVEFVNAEPVNKQNQEGYNKYLFNLRKNEVGLNLSTDARDVFMREIDRLYKLFYERYLINKYEETFEKFGQDAQYSDVSVQKVLDLYASKVRRAYTEYVTEDAAESYNSDMKSDATQVYYYPERGKDTKYFQVAHVLIQFNDTVTKEAYSDLISKGITGDGDYTDQDAFNTQLNKFLSDLKPIVRKKQENENGEIEWVETTAENDYEKSAITLADEIKLEIDKLDSVEQKLSLFNEFIYKYGDDPGMINAQHNYSVGVNANEAEKGEKYKVYSSWVKEFEAAAVELYQDGNGQIGDVSNYVVTENGVHVLMYLGEIDNIFNVTSNFTLKNNELINGLTPIEILANTRLNIFSEKTYFDVLYEELESTDSGFNATQMKTLRSKYNVTYHKNNYEDLL